MENLVHDYPCSLGKGRDFELKLPIGAKILYCKNRGGQSYITCEISQKEERTETRQFFSVGPDQVFLSKGLQYIGTTMSEGGILYHVYERMILRTLEKEQES